MSPYRHLFIITAVLLGNIATLVAQIRTWQAGTSDWNTAGNWTTANVPDSNAETATFSSTGSTTVDLSTDTTIQLLVFGANSQAYTIQSATSKILTIDINSAANIVGLSTTATSGAVIMNNNLVITDSNGAPNQSQFTLAAGSSLTLNGTLSIAAANTFVATGAVNTGSLFINGSVVFGNGSSALRVALNASENIFFNPTSVTTSAIGTNGLIQAQSSVGKFNLMGDFSSGQLSIGVGTGANPVGLMYLKTAGMSMSRDLTFNSGTGGTGDMTFAADMSSGGTATQAGSIVISTGAAGGTYTNNLEATDANDVMDITGVISGTQGSGTTNIKKTGNGTVKFSGSSSNTFASAAGTLTLEVAAGVLALNKTAGLDAITNVRTTVDSGATLRWDASNQINNSASVVLNGGALNFNGQSETMGTLDLDAASSLTFALGAETILFSDSSALNWGAFNLTVNAFDTSRDFLKFGTNASGLTAAQLLLFNFVEYGGVAGQIDSNGFVTPLANNTALVDASIYSGTSGVTQAGTGSLTLIGASTSTGTATVNSGLLTIGTTAGGSWAGNVIVNGGTFRGRGTISGSITLNGGVYSPGNSPGIQQVGSLIVNSGGTLLIEVDGTSAGNGAGFYDQVQSVGAATLNGGTLQGQTIFTGSSGFSPPFGTRINFLTASSVTGKFDTHDFGSNSAGQSWIAEYRDTEMNLFAVPANWGRDIAGMNSNQKILGRALQSFAPPAIDNRGSPVSGLVSGKSDQGKIFNGLMRLDNGELKTAYDQLSPEKLSAMSSSVTGLSSIGNTGATQRLNQIRGGARGVSLNGISLRTMDGDYEYESLALNKGAMLVQKKKETHKNGFFINTTGSYSQVDSSENRIGFENRFGGLTAGIDQAITDNLTVGAFASQGYSNALLSGGGELEANTGRLGVYGGYQYRGFYVNTSLSGGLTSFDTKRKISFLGETAEGSTQGYDITGQVATGVDFQTGNWVWGPVAKVDYGYQKIDQFREHGSAARLQVSDQKSPQVETGLGMRVSRPFDSKGWKWIPEMHLLGSYQWYQPGEIQSRFEAGGDSFTVHPEGAGQAMIIPGAGMSLLLNDQNTVYMNYEARLNAESQAHQLDLGWQLKF